MGSCCWAASRAAAARGPWPTLLTEPVLIGPGDESDDADTIDRLGGVLGNRLWSGEGVFRRPGPRSAVIGLKERWMVFGDELCGTGYWVPEGVRKVCGFPDDVVRRGDCGSYVDPCCARVCGGGCICGFGDSWCPCSIEAAADCVSPARRSSSGCLSTLLFLSSSSSSISSRAES